MQPVANGELKPTVHVLIGRINLCCDLPSPMEFHRYVNFYYGRNLLCDPDRCCPLPLGILIWAVVFKKLVLCVFKYLFAIALCNLKCYVNENADYKEKAITKDVVFHTYFAFLHGLR